MPLVFIEDRLDPVEARDGETLLSALKRAGIAIGYSCEAGQCGTCRCELLAGAPRELDHSGFALTPAQRARGYVLACRSVVHGDLRIRILDADELVVHPIRDLSCELVERSSLARDVWKLVFRIRAGGPFVFSAGQYAKIEFITRAGERLLRDFSIASTPITSEFDGIVEFHVRAVTGGTFARLLDEGAVEPGAALRIIGPEGTSYLRPGFEGPMLLVAGSSGLAPILAIAETAVDAGLTQPICIYVGMRAEADVYGEDRLNALAARAANVQFEYILSDPEGPTRRRTGLVTDAIRADLGNLAAAKAYLAGPPVMVEAAVELLRARGMIDRNIHTDAYYAAVPPEGGGV